jgi:hypothetical protein
VVEERGLGRGDACVEGAHRAVVDEVAAGAGRDAPGREALVRAELRRLAFGAQVGDVHARVDDREVNALAGHAGVRELVDREQLRDLPRVADRRIADAGQAALHHRVGEHTEHRRVRARLGEEGLLGLVVRDRPADELGDIAGLVGELERAGHRERRAVLLGDPRGGELDGVEALVEHEPGRDEGLGGRGRRRDGVAGRSSGPHGRRRPQLDEDAHRPTLAGAGPAVNLRRSG